ncbi:hypothetical protein M413DRAFT_71303 [Hebeloma cylindrosporum]|uniref:Apple domain-containing protein n=1 Tax=Hebeloma cylindrosporum TaxID=76867 RepID=A0A0C2XVL0_HEBCY|nr:hypothetical protein M413DRAFT_71303 [Hebeloma cylindrosporum h7]
MRFAPILSVVAVAVSGVAANPVASNPFDLSDVVGHDVSANNHYGAPTPPWSGGRPGWYYGNNPSNYKQYPCLTGIICQILKYFPHALQCPAKPPKPTPTTSSAPIPTSTVPEDGYTQTFSNLTGATQADDYMTYGLVDTVADCKTMCNTVQGCKFANSYHDVNGKDGSTQLTCSLFTSCHDASSADNYGGQTQPDGSIDFITNSDGWCKVA